jgi:general secretion pathway protein D
MELIMKSINTRRSLVSLIVVACLLAVPVGAWGKKGGEHYDRGMKYEQAQQWEKAAQEFTLAIAADPSNVEYQLHYRRAVFNASQTFMQQGRALAEQRDYVGAYNAFRQAFGYDPVNQLAVSEMERMLRLQAVKDGTATPSTSGDGAKSDESENPGTPSTPSASRPQDIPPAPRQEQVRVINYSGDLKSFIRTLAEQLSLNVVFDRQTFVQPRTLEISLHDVTTAKALDYIFLQENLFFQKLDRRTILVADVTRRPQYQQLVMRTFYLSNMKPSDAANFVQKAIPASVGRPNMVVVTEEGTNSITVRDTAENVRLISDLLSSIDKDRAEVVMDVNIYEVNRTSLLQLGNQIGTGTFNLGGSGGLSILTPNVQRIGQPQGVNLASLIGGVPTSAAAALVFPPSVLTAFQSKSNGRLIASTQVHAFNGEESMARIGQRVPVQTAQVYGYQPTTGTGTGVNSGILGTNGYPVINYEPTGLTLKFTPTVFPNLDVQVKMNIESKDVTGANTLTPTFSERTITGTARVQNNRTMLLASVSQNIESNGRQGLPVLGGLPILGRLFTSPTRDNRQVDIVIAVTPRVLRAPAVTPRDEKIRDSGTTMSPTSGSLEAMLRETVREEQIAAARQIPKEVVIQLPDAPVTYVPAPNALVTNQSAPTETAANTNPAGSQTVAATSASFRQNNDAANPQSKDATAALQTRQAVTSGEVAASSGTDASMPAPKSAVQTVTEPQAPKTIDVATAIKNIVSPAAGTSPVAETRQNASVQNTVESLSPKTDASAQPSQEAVKGLTEIKLAPSSREMKVGAKQLIAIDFKSDAPIAMAVLTLRFDPGVIKVNSVLPGVIFLNAKTAPTITQSIDPQGMLLVSITPANGPIRVTGEGSLLNLEVEAIGTGDSGLAFDPSNMHFVASDGRAAGLQIGPARLTVKQ